MNGTSATFSGTLTLNGASNQIRSGNELRFYRADNGIYTTLNDAGSGTANGFILNNTNGEGFHFKNGATSAVRISSSGNVGIGTTTPERDSGTRSLAISGGGSIAASLDLYGNARNFAIFTGGVGSLGFFDLTAGAQRMTITSSGNVGIGTTAPTAQLQISSASGGLISINSTTTNSFRGITFQNNAATDSTEYAYIKYNATSGEMRYYANPAAFGGFTTFYSNNTESMRITSSGNLGVGTTAPTSRLSVIAATGAAAMRIEADSGQNAISIGGTGIINVDYPGVGGGRFSVSDNGNIGMPRTYGFTTSNAANLFIDSSGLLYRSTSSIKYKTNVKNYDKGLDILSQMRPVYYNGNGDSDSGKTFAGLIAEEIHDLGLTEFVQYAQDGTPDALAYSNMVSLLVKGIQELKAELDTLKNK